MLRTKICITSVMLATCLYGKAPKQHDWQAAEEKSDNAVVQVISHHTVVNWLEPYKAPKQREGSGTAFFIDNQGRLLTNFHVVDGAKTLQVYVPLLGQKPLEATVLGVCPEADVALIQITKAGMDILQKALGKIPSLSFGDSDLLYPTEPVLALGYPLGQRYLKSTVGVVAGREYIDGHSYMHITAPINPGNSGGPLLNIEGKVVGINSAGIPGAQNIGYIVPIYDAQILLKDLASTKLVNKPNLGIRYNATTDEHAQMLGNPTPAGVYIYYVEPKSLADKAGLRPGDMLYKINNYTIDAYGDVQVNWPNCSKISLDELRIRIPLNEIMSLSFYRAGQKKVVQCPFGSPVLHPVRFVYPDYEKNELDYEIIAGMCIMQLRLNHLDYFERIVELHEFRAVKNQLQEVLIVTNIFPGSEIDKVNCFYPGMLLSKLNGKDVCNLAQVRQALKESATTGYVSFQSKENIATAVSVDKVLKEEQRLTKDFMFTSTKAMVELKELRQGVVKKKKK